MQKNKSKLKPCPFCGGRAIGGISSRNGFTFYQVFCTDCGCSTKEYSSKDMAVERWNKRTSFLLRYKGDYRCPDCDTYNEAWERREHTVHEDIVYCWHCGTGVRLGGMKKGEDAVGNI